MRDLSELKKQGSAHYKTGGVEPIDLYESVGVLPIFALCNIIKYAFRNLTAITRGGEANPQDVKKMQHYLDMVALGEEKKPPGPGQQGP